MMAEKYSSLEVAPNERREPFPEVIDQAADAPERDLSGDAPELDDKSRMHQVSRNVHYSHQCIQSFAKSPSRTSPFPPRLLTPHPLDPTSKIRPGTLRQGMALLIQMSIRKGKRRH